MKHEENYVGTLQSENKKNTQDKEANRKRIIDGLQ